MKSVMLHELGKAMVEWVDARSAMPDDDETVLIVLEDGEVWTGFRDAGDWRYVSADLVEPEVLFWARFPEPPERKAA